MNRLAAIDEAIATPATAVAAQHRRYPAYIPTGSAWLGELPRHWTVRRLKFSLARNDGGVWGDDFDPEGTVVLRSTEQTVGGGWNIVEPARRSLSATERAAGLLATDDLLITKSSGSELHIGKTSIVTEEVASLQCCFSNFMQRLRCSGGLLPKLVFYVLNSPIGREQFVYGSNTTTGLANLNGRVIGNLLLAVPPLNEQRAIAAFLDRETARIDALIAQKQRLVELLHEKRGALISHAFRGDGRTNATEGDSEFFPRIPAGWSLTRLKFVCRDVADGPHFSPQYVDEGIPFLSARNVKVDRWSLGDAKFIDEGLYREFCKRVKPERGDVLYTKGGTTGIARAVDFDEPFHVWVHIIVLKLKPSLINPFFLAYALNSSGCYEQSQLYTRGATNNDLGLTRVINIHFPLCNLAMQTKIVAELDDRCGRLDRLSETIGRHIDGLREYRSALISAAVTGKIDVRNG